LEGNPKIFRNLLFWRDANLEVIRYHAYLKGNESNTYMRITGSPVIVNSKWNVHALFLNPQSPNDFNSPVTVQYFVGNLNYTDAALTSLLIFRQPEPSVSIIVGGSMLFYNNFFEGAVRFFRIDRGEANLLCANGDRSFCLSTTRFYGFGLTVYDLETDFLCNPGLFLDPSNFYVWERCIKSCPQKYQDPEASGLCLPCPQRCILCSKGDECFLCDSSFKLFRMSSCHDPCPPPSFAWINNSVNSCLQCHPLCLNCTEATEYNCTGCVPGATWIPSLNLCYLIRCGDGIAVETEE
jgi:hypothetical protein